MFRSILLRRASAGAIALAFASSSPSALAQEALPAIEVGSAQPAAAGADTAGPSGQGGEKTSNGFGSPADKETGYARSTGFAATKTNTPLLDTPVSVQIVPREVIEDKQILNAMEATRNVSGVQAQPGTYYDQYQIRGFPSTAQTYRNGLKLYALFNAEDIAFTDRVEIVKGPASVLYGRIDPGGFVNIVTKRPQEEFKASVNEQVGNWGLSRTTADVTGAANAEKTLLYRVMGVFDHADSWTNFDHRNNGAAAAFFTIRPTTQFEFNLQFEHYEATQTTPPGSGQIPVITATKKFGSYLYPLTIAKPLNLPRSFSDSDPTMWTNFPYVQHRTLYAFDWSYKLDDKWKISNRFHYLADDETQTGLSVQTFNPVTYVATRRFTDNPLQRDMLSTNLDLSGEILTGPLKHELLAGVDWYSYVDQYGGYIGPGALVPKLNIFSPVYGNVTGIGDYYSNIAQDNILSRSRQRDFGVYAQDQMSFFDDRAHVLLGARWDEAQVATQKTYGNYAASCFPLCTGFPMNQAFDAPRVSPRAGLLFKLTDEMAVYGSYSRSFGTNNGVSASGVIFAPEEALQWETGLKGQWYDGKLTASLTLFDLTKKNVLQADPLNPGTSTPVGTVLSRGVELDVAGQVTENLSVIGSYTFDSAKITYDHNNGTTGHRFNGVAPNVGNIWAKWDTAPGLPEGWEFGGGFYAMDRRWGDNLNTWVLPAYVTFDAMTAYRTLLGGHKVTFRINVKNLADTRYFAYTDNGTNAYYGAPRTVIGSVNFQF
jgi:iron complex outermembrane recepter protein